MSTTVRETLALDSFKGFSVLAGFDGLDREITCTTFIEAPDSWKWIRGGEFVITLAYAYQTEEQLYMLVKELIDRGATCIGIKTERFIKKVPQSVLDLADAHEFPIIYVPIAVPFADIIQPVQSLVIHDQARLLKYSERVRHTFFDLSIKAAEIEEIIQTLREFTHLDLVFIDTTSEKKYFASDSARLPSDVDTLPLKDVLANYPYESIAIDKKLWGYLIFDVEREKLKDRWSEIPINQAKGTLLLYLQRREAQRQVESRYRNEFVQDLITHNIRMEQEAWNRAKTFNWDLTGAQMVVVVDIDNYKSQLTHSIAQGEGAAALENAKGRIYSISRSFLAHLGGRKYPYAEMSDSVVYIFPAGRDAAGDRFRDLLRRTLSDMMKAVTSETGFTVTVGIGDPCENVFDCPESYRQAQQGLELLRQSTGGNVIALWEEMGVYKLLYCLVGTTEGRNFIQTHLGALLKNSDHSDEVLLKTLFSVVGCNWNLKDSAAALDVHYNTLKYRWKKICSLLGIDPSKSGDRLNVMIALRLLRMEKNML